MQITKTEQVVFCSLTMYMCTFCGVPAKYIEVCLYSPKKKTRGFQDIRFPVISFVLHLIKQQVHLFAQLVFLPKPLFFIWIGSIMKYKYLLPFD